MSPVRPHAAQQASMYPSRGRRTTKWHARMDGLPGLPGAHQDGGRPTSNSMPGRFAPARRPDRSRGNPGATWVVTPSVEGQLRSSAPAVTPSECLPKGHKHFGWGMLESSDPEGQLRSRAPAVTPSRIGSRAPGSSDGVCLMAVTRRGSSGAKLQPSRPRESGAELQDHQMRYA